jgi:hypothetical protein
MKREKLISEITDVIASKIDELAEANGELWDCYLPSETAEQMARAAVAIIEAYETSEAFVKHYAGTTP